MQLPSAPHTLLSSIAMKIGSFVALTLAAILLGLSEGSNVDFFHILDQTTAEFLLDGSNHFGRSSSAAILKPRNNKYLEASMQIIRGMAEANGTSRRLSSRGRRKMMLSVEKALLDKEIPKARNLVGHLIRPECHCPPQQGPCRESDLPQHCKTNEHENVFKKLRDVLNEDQFESLLGITGDVSLIFVIDTSGSMGDEIEAAKKIAKAIAAHRRDAPVQYILAPFSDPFWGNTYSCPNENAFVEALDTLTASGGRDCPELTFNGVIDAIEIGGPIVGSPMFVFTDAGAKEGDSVKYNLENALGLAVSYEIPVNFFYSTEYGSCGAFHRHDSLVDLLDGSGGFGMQFNSSGEIQKMSGVMSAALDGTATILEGRSSGGRATRSARDKTYTVPVDDTVKTLLVTYITSNDPNLVELRNPDWLPQPRTENLAKGGLWIINHPTPGVWSLFFPAAIGTHTVKVQSTTGFNLDFDFIFLLGKEIGGQLFEYQIDYPLLGDVSTMNLIIPLKERLNLTTLSLSLVDKSGRELETTVNLATPSLVGTFDPPLTPFKLKLSAITAEGWPFQRMSRTFITAKNVSLRLHGGKAYNTLRCGKTLRLAFVIDYIGEGGERFDVTVNSSVVNTTTTAIKARYRPVVWGLRSSEAYVIVWLTTPRDVTQILGKWATIKVTVKRSPARSQVDMTSFTDHFKVTCPS